MLVVAIIAIVFVGPKELPGMLRTFGRIIKKVRGMAGEFQTQFNDALEEAELDGLKDSINDVKSLDPTKAIKDKLNPLKDTEDKTAQKTPDKTPQEIEAEIARDFAKAQADAKAKKAKAASSSAGATSKAKAKTKAKPKKAVAKKTAATKTKPKAKPAKTADPA